MKKSFEITVKVKNCPISFKEGMEKGVLASIQVTYDLNKINNPMLMKSLMDEEDRLVKEVIETTIKEVK